MASTGSVGHTVLTGVSTPQQALQLESEWRACLASLEYNCKKWNHGRQGLEENKEEVTRDYVRGDHEQCYSRDIVLIGEVSMPLLVASRTILWASIRVYAGTVLGIATRR